MDNFWYWAGNTDKAQRSDNFWENSKNNSTVMQSVDAKLALHKIFKTL